MPVTSLNISLPKPLRDYVEEQVKSGGYQTPSKFVQVLVRDDRNRKMRERVEGLLLEGIDSGAAIPADSQYWENKRRRLTQRFPKKKTKVS